MPPHQCLTLSWREDPSPSRHPRSSSCRLWWRRRSSPRVLRDRPLLLCLRRCDDEEDLLRLLLLLRLRLCGSGLRPREEPEEGETEGSESEEVMEGGASRDLFLSRPCRRRRRLLSLSPPSLPISFRCVCVFYSISFPWGLLGRKSVGDGCAPPDNAKLRWPVSTTTQRSEPGGGAGATSPSSCCRSRGREERRGRGGEGRGSEARGG
jgi:hypothetical protein